MIDFKAENKLALFTGCSRGIGLAVGRGLALKQVQTLSQSAKACLQPGVKWKTQFWLKAENFIHMRQIFQIVNRCINF